ncbi:BON domain-containing protein [Pseudoduganella violacea]|uniref:Osmotically-inducible protein OsmY n=1 Tax=Pseudoduganella violacea TaxID=1715466 RepID=A0A7W5FS48_9BURK|nr:BON domain-containing protein [Pseudoduganella violacea]MBB3117365.1 osmotically-inducible protein OsmY [Pseudoduganella violacea]
MSKSRSLHARLARPVALVLIGGALLSTLSGCVGLVAAGAVAGTVAASDRRTFGAQTEDKAIGLKADVRLPNVLGNAGHVNVNAFNRKVLITGEVADEAMKASVEREVKAIENVESVVNELEIAGPASFTSRSNDALITTKVKASLIDSRDISANSFKIVTERGAVFLMGRVTQREGNIAAEIARGVSGVSKVVKVFEYITEEEWKQYQPTPQQQQQPAAAR